MSNDMCIRWGQFVLGLFNLVAVIFVIWGTASNEWYNNKDDNFHFGLWEECDPTCSNRSMNGREIGAAITAVFSSVFAVMILLTGIYNPWKGHSYSRWVFKLVMVILLLISGTITFTIMLTEHDPHQSDSPTEMRHGAIIYAIGVFWFFVPLIMDSVEGCYRCANPTDRRDISLGEWQRVGSLA